MDRNDRQAIEHLFDKLAAVERNSPPRDAASEALIRERLAAQPGAPYYMAQTIVVQDQALAAAEARIAALEGGNDLETRRSGSVPKIGRGQPVPQAQGGGGFLAGAAQTALGVASGLLLGNAIAGMLGGGEAQAAQTNSQTEKSRTEEPETEDAETDDAGFDAGGDFGDF